MIGAPLLLSATLGTLFGVNDAQSAWTGIATVPIFFWELSVGLWMTFKGFDLGWIRSHRRGAPSTGRSAGDDRGGRDVIPEPEAGGGRPDPDRCRC